MNILKFYGFLIFVFICLVSCSTDTTSSGTPSDISKENDDIKNNALTLSDSEFVYSYTLLEMSYYLAEEELKEPEYYYDLESGITKFGNTYQMYMNLSDLYTSYIPPEYFESFYSSLFEATSNVGIGIEFNDSLFITQVYPESPASKAKIKKGDKIIAIDGIEIEKKETAERLLTGSVADEIELSVYDGDSVKNLDLVFEEVILPTVFVDSVGQIPRIRITEFSDETYANFNTYKEWMQALNETSGAKAMMIDLRNNPGGDAEMCLNMASELLHKNDTVAITVNAVFNEETEKQEKDTTVYAASTDGLASDRYVVFLANSETASCSEVLMQAAIANKKSPIVGETTYGKAVGLEVFITYATGIAIIANSLLYDKDFNTYNARGFAPDYESTDEEEILAKALEFIEVKQTREASYGDTFKALAKTSKNGKNIEKPGFYFLKERK